LWFLPLSFLPYVFNIFLYISIELTFFQERPKRRKGRREVSLLHTPPPASSAPVLDPAAKPLITITVPVLPPTTVGSANIPPIATLPDHADSSEDDRPISSAKATADPKSKGKRKASGTPKSGGRASKRSKDASVVDADDDEDVPEEGFPKRLRKGRAEAADKEKGSPLQPVPELSPEHLVDSLSKGSSMVRSCFIFLR
jgi:hypothetical protein